MEQTSALHAEVGDPLPPGCHVLEIHLGELKQLFNAIDPAPFRERDLDPKAEEFIVGWAPSSATYWSRCCARRDSAG